MFSWERIIAISAIAATATMYQAGAIDEPVSAIRPVAMNEKDLGTVETVNLDGKLVCPPFCARTVSPVPIWLKKD